jgi:hypothetical protein
MALMSTNVTIYGFAGITSSVPLELSMTISLCRSRWFTFNMMEYNFIMKIYVWEIVPRPVEKSIVDSKWLYEVKHTIDGII